MKFSYYLPGPGVTTGDTLFNAAELTRLAQAAEEAGYSSISIDDHPAPPHRWRSDGLGHDCLEPFVALAAIAAGTSKIRLTTGLTILPYRNPFLVAKSVATLDALSGGRVVLGLGVGYLPDEYAALGVDFDSRNELFDESIHVLKLAWTGEPVTYKGLFFDAVEICVNPRPVQRPHPPIWIGGNSKLSLRRVAEYGAGWMSMPSRGNAAISRRSAPMESVEDFIKLRDYLRSYAESIGRTDPIEISGGPIMTGDDVIGHLHFLEELGVSQSGGGAGGTDLQGRIDALNRFSDEVISKF